MIDPLWRCVEEGLCAAIKECDDRVQRIVVGFSGGLDSSVLLHLLQGNLEAELGLALHALHVNHGLQGEANDWEKHCMQQGKAYGVGVSAVQVSVAVGDGLGLEHAARGARYAAFSDFMQEGDLLLLAHHQNDQAETVLYRLLRGSGPLGLAAMRSIKPFSGTSIVRPLLASSRSELEAYAQHHALVWIEDPSNAELCFDRNYLRREIMPRLEERWPGVNDTFSRAAELNQETVALLEELAEQDFHAVGVERDQGLCQTQPSQKLLCQKQLRQMTGPRINNLLRYWLSQSGRPLPSRVNLMRIYQELVLADVSGAAVVEWAGAEVRVFDGRLYCMANLGEVPAIGSRLIWSSANASEQFDCGSQMGMLSSRLTLGQGLNVQMFEDARKQGVLTVKWREGGERCQPDGRPHSQLLKKLLQEYRVPPWLRSRLPMVCIGETLVAVPGLWVCKGFSVGPGEEGRSLYWQSAINGS